MNEKKDYKDTLNLPETAFPMKANLPRMEPEILKLWQEKNIYKKMQEKAEESRPFILHDGPPYANGHIHMGHALNKVLKDIIVKYKAMKGFKSPYVPGWDCHGLPIEIQVDKNLGEKKHTTPVLEKRRLCREYASKFVDIQREEFRRLGVFGRWEKPYLTMTNDYEASIIREFNEFVKRGYVYRGKKPVHWCPNCVTALAEAEVEYAEKESPSVYVSFRLLDDDALKLSLFGDVFLVIWTTTPWTLPANMALAVNPDIEYAAVETHEGHILILARELLGPFREEHVELGRVVKSFPGKVLEGLRARHPFIDRESVIIEADFVTTGEGTGIVHIAPGHGEDDFEAGTKHGLDIYAPVDDKGKFVNTGIAELDGEFVFKANAKIIEMLEEKGALLAQRKITHSYPHCWRCKKPVIFRATQQWFISMRHDGLREKCLSEIERVRWVPHWGKQRIKGMVERRPDWCVSRQRAWGVPIALFKCKSCKEPLVNPQVLDKIERIFRERGSDIWFEEPPAGIDPASWILGTNIPPRCERCGATGYEKETDILDVWFDSGVSHAAVLLEDTELSWPADLYLEGSDQHRGWFQSSLLASVGTRGRAPYAAVLTHGFVVDGKGRKMSKSLGNVVAPDDIIRKHGAEILRLWASAEDYSDDIRLSSEILERLTEAYRKIRNTARYLLGNLNDFDAAKTPQYEDLQEIDRWALSRLQGLIRNVDRAYGEFAFHEVYHRLYNFCVVDMSSFYLDILKDRLYTFRKDSPKRRAAQWVLREILLAITKLMAPVLSFTAEEIWGHIKGTKEESVFLSDFPEPIDRYDNPLLEDNWRELILIRDEVNKALEIKRQEKFIGTALEAKVTIYAKKREYDLLKLYEKHLPELFIVSQIELFEAGGRQYEDAFFASSEVPGLKVDVGRAQGSKCQRCWNWSPTVGTFEDAPELCLRCHAVLHAVP